MRGSGCGPAEEKKYTYICIYICIYITKNAHWCYISPVRGCAVSQLIVVKFGTLIELIYVIDFAKFGADRSQGWGQVSSQIFWFCLYSRSRP